MCDSILLIMRRLEHTKEPRVGKDFDTGRIIPGAKVFNNLLVNWWLCENLSSVILVGLSISNTAYEELFNSDFEVLFTRPVFLFL